MNISIVIPAYNESNNIKTTIQELFLVLEKIREIDKIQIIIVDDHSSDNTYESVKRMKDTGISCLRLSRRCGSHTALRVGLKEATGDAVLCISADGQDNFAVTGEMLKKWHNGAEVVWGLRKNRKNEPWYIRIPAQMFYRLILWLSDVEKKDIDLSRADFFLLGRRIVDAINNCSERNTSLFGLIIWMGFNQDFIEYERRLRRSGKSKWNFRSKLHLAKDWIIGFSGIPLKTMSILGTFFALVGFLYGIYIVVNFICGNPQAGWSSIMVGILVLGGIQMIMLGVVGEYLWRNLDETRKRPLYFIERDSKNNKN